MKCLLHWNHKHSNNICEQIQSYNNEYNNYIKPLYNNIIYNDKHWNTEWLTSAVNDIYLTPVFPKKYSHHSEK